jgi:hypothetical protein
MDATTLCETVDERAAKRLDHLDSRPVLRAVAGGEPEATRLLHAAADSEAAARDTFAAWAADESDDRLAAAFARVADQERDHYRRVWSFLPEHEAPTAAGPLHAFLRSREGPIERIAAGMVGRVTISQRVHAAMVEWFAERDLAAEAALFRDLRAETVAVRQDGAGLLNRYCTAPDDWQPAGSAAEYTVQVGCDALGLPEPASD